MLNFLRINDVSDPLFSKLFNLYTITFPRNERRNWAGLEHEVLYEKRFNPNVLLKDEEFVGFFNYWSFERFSYIEHLAIIPTLRNQKLGSEAMEIFKKKSNLPIILEVEMPNNTVAIQRIRFYEQHGFTVLSHNYAQPPYDEKSEFFLPELIMCNDVHFGNTHFEKIKETLYTEVYHYELEKEEND
ncbi:MAG: GNAT family N-acetyltransferase [Paludibacter sp.]|jgi:ribosomal protein S18 acetylase RimI-like enzyme